MQISAATPSDRSQEIQNPLRIWFRIMDILNSTSATLKWHLTDEYSWRHWGKSYSTSHVFQHFRSMDGFFENQPRLVWRKTPVHNCTHRLHEHPAKTCSRKVSKQGKNPGEYEIITAQVKSGEKLWTIFIIIHLSRTYFCPLLIPPSGNRFSERGEVT